MNSESLRPIVHVGFPKTASTSLQKHLFAKLDADKVDAHVAYNGSDIALAIRDIALALSEDSSGMTARPVIDRVTERLQAIQNRQDRRVILSHEGLCGRPWDAFQSRHVFFDLLLRSLKDPIILVVVREPFEWIESLYRFSLRSEALAPERFLCWDENDFVREFRHGRKAAVNMARLSPAAVIKDLFSTFGEKNVVVLDYSYVVSDIERFALDFADWIDVEFSDAGALSTVEKKSPSYYRHTLYYLPRNRLRRRAPGRLKKVVPVVSRLLDGISRAATTLPGNDRKLLSSYRNRIDTNFADDYAFIKAHFRTLDEVSVDAR